MRRLFVPAALALFAVPGTAAAQTGGAQYTPAPWLAARAFSITPASIAPGTTLTVRYRIDGRARRMRVRIDLVPAGGGPVAARLPLGLQPTGRRLTATWTPELAPGRYSARLRATARHGSARASRRRAIEFIAPTVTAAAGLFPVAGPYTLGGSEARFGAGRTGHSHRGQDILAAAGTPVVAPVGGSVGWRAYQAGGAGHYVVVHGVDGRDYVFMHLRDGSVLVQKGQAVRAGEQLGEVGATGRADGPHLHFEIWTGGWYADGGTAIDPLPDLLAWAG